MADLFCMCCIVFDSKPLPRLYMHRALQHSRGSVLAHLGGTHKIRKRHQKDTQEVVTQVRLWRWFWCVVSLSRFENFEASSAVTVGLEVASFPFIISAAVLRIFLRASRPTATSEENEAPPRVHAPYGENAECPICLELPQLRTTTTCGHRFCSACIIRYWQEGTHNNESMQCPTCRQRVILLQLQGGKRSRKRRNRPAFALINFLPPTAWDLIEISQREPFL